MTDAGSPVAAISGAAGDLGRVTAARLAADGFAVAACGRSADRLEVVRSDLGIAGERWHAHAADLVDPAGAQGWRDAAVDRFGRVDALVHLVGGWRGGTPLPEAPLADYEWLHDTLVRTTQNVTRAFFADLTAAPAGRFLIISSPQALRPTAGNASYGAAKAAAEAWTLALADSFAPTPATANVIAVGAILTEAMRAENPDKPYATFTPAADVAEAIAFVCSERASRMNGRRLPLHP